MCLIKITNLDLGYSSDPILKNINLKINPGDFVSVIGNNGTGKSTFIKGILGLLKPMNGSIEFFNMQRNYIGYLPQDAHIDNHFPASVYEVVLSGTLNQRGLKLAYSKKEKNIANNQLKLLKIENLKEKNINELSGGQRQKVLLARSLCATKKLLVLDEPASGLDSQSKNNLYEILNYLNKEKKMTIIMVTHEQNIIGNKIFHLKENDYYFGEKPIFRGGRRYE